MKKTLIVALSLMLVVGMASMAMALNQGQASGVLNSIHNLVGKYGVDSTEVCKVCHTPHAAMTGIDALLWNRTNSTQTYTTYESSTLTAGTAPQPSGHSKLCLSCHDGTVAMDAFGGEPAGSAGSLMTDIGANFTIGGGGDLSGTHPVSVVYDELGDNNGVNGLKPLASAAFQFNNVSEVLGSGGTVECSTCHDVHDQNLEAVGGTSLLRETTDGSAICLACHAKDQ